MLQWNTPGTKTYEDGVDRAVLYPYRDYGVPWNGLVSVDETLVGGESTPVHLDGNKFAELVGNTDFQATITAFGAPPEFEACDGSQQLAAGLFVTQQPRKPFDLTYRTGIGNDVLGEDFGYKIHLVYNCIASPANRTRRTRSNQPEPEQIQWTVNTVPTFIPGFKPTAHIVLDTRTTPLYVINKVEGLAYRSGTATLPTPADLIQWSEEAP